MKKAFSYFINALSTIIIVLSLFVLLSVVLTRPGQAPQVLGFSAFRVLTGSMEPEIPEDTLLFVRQTEPTELTVGDIITFYSSDPALRGGINTHRIAAIEVNESGVLTFSTKGDANLVTDTYPVMPEQLIGRVIGKSLFLGRLCGMVSNPIVFVPVIFLPLLALLLYNMVKSIRLAREAVLQEELEETAPQEGLEAAKPQEEPEEADPQTDTPQQEELPLN